MPSTLTNLAIKVFIISSNLLLIWKAESSVLYQKWRYSMRTALLEGTITSSPVITTWWFKTWRCPNSHGLDWRGLADERLNVFQTSRTSPVAPTQPLYFPFRLHSRFWTVVPSRSWTLPSACCRTKRALSTSWCSRRVPTRLPPCWRQRAEEGTDLWPRTTSKLLG